MLNKRRGQSTVEYIVLVSAVIAVAVAFFLAPTSQFKTTMNDTLTDTTDQIANMEQRLLAGQPLSPAGVNSPAPAVTTGIVGATQFCAGTKMRQPNGTCA